jgi:hypothetical protein
LYQKNRATHPLRQQVNFFGRTGRKPEDVAPIAYSLITHDHLQKFTLASCVMGISRDRHIVD